MGKKNPNQNPKMLRKGLLTPLRLKDLVLFVSNTNLNVPQCNSQSCRRWWFVERMWECSFYQTSDILISGQNIANTYLKKGFILLFRRKSLATIGISPVKSPLFRPKLLLFLPSEKEWWNFNSWKCTKKEAINGWNTHPAGGINTISHKELLVLLFSAKAKNLQENKSSSILQGWRPGEQERLILQLLLQENKNYMKQCSFLQW